MKKDLIVIVADSEMELIVNVILSRYESLGIRNITFDIESHEEHDPGCFLRAHEFVRGFEREYSYVMVLFDREGCGREKWTREKLEKDVEKRLMQCGWKDRSSAVAIDPELEIWIWSDSTCVADVLGWAGHYKAWEEWKIKQGLVKKDCYIKPKKPKELYKKTVKSAPSPKRISTNLLLKLAKQINYESCNDPAFTKLKMTLKKWFGY